MLHLASLVIADDWSAHHAAARLVAHVHDPRVLRALSRRVQGALLERPSEIGIRADRTVAHALATVQAA